MGENLKNARMPETTPWTIGLLVDALESGYHSQVLSGAVVAARERGARLICFAGGQLQSPSEVSRHNALYDLVGSEKINGLVLMSGALGGSIGLKDIKHFAERYHPLPIVSVAAELEGIPSVLTDNRQGMREAIEHLVRDHGFRRLAFICGPMHSPDATARYQAYEEALREYGLPLCEELVVQGDFRRLSGEKALQHLWERQVEFEAIIAANDEMALGVLKALKKNEVRLSKEIPVIGFDDVEESEFVVPGLTTVHQPLYEEGYKAVEMVLTLMPGSDNPITPESVCLPTELIVRQSCGCPARIGLPSGIENQVHQRFKVEHRSRILSEISRELIVPHSLPELKDVIRDGLTRLEIQSCYLSLYEGEAIPAESSRLFLAYKEEKRQEAMEKQLFSSSHLVPADLLPASEPYTLVVEPLYFRERQLGFAVFEIGLQEWVVYDELCEQISSALNGALLEQSQKRHEVDMQTLLDFRAEIAAVFDVERILELILHKVCNLMEADGGYAALIDHKTGHLEKELSVPGGYLQTGSVSPLENESVRQTLQQGEPLLLDNVSSDPKWHTRLGPEVGSLLGVPIMAHGLVRGALVLVSKHEYHFTHDAQRFLQALIGQAVSAIEHADLSSALLEFGRAPSALELDRQLKAVLHELTEVLKFESAAIWLIDNYRDTIEIFGEKNLAPGWLRRSKFNLLNPGILTEVVRTRKSYLDDETRLDQGFEEWNPQAKLVRWFVPLLAGEDVVGVIEVGCQDEKRSEVLTQQTIQAIEQLGLEKGKIIGLARPHVLLELIADHAIKIIGADSASVHVFQTGSPLPDSGKPVFLLEAGAGREIKKFLKKFRPRPNGIGQRALQAGSQLVMDVPEKLAEDYPEIYEEGIRAIAAFPLFLGAEVQGILYIHFRQEHRFSPAELELEAVFTRQIKIVILNYLNLKQIRRDLERRNKELEALHIIERAIAASVRGDDLRQIFGLILERALEITRSPIGQIYRYLGLENILELYAERGISRQPQVSRLNLGDGIVGQAASLRKSILAPDVRVGEWAKVYNPVVPETRSELAVPLMDGNELLGVLNLEHHEIDAFEEEDQALLETFAVQAIVAVRSADLYQKLERQIRPLRALSVITSRIHDIRYDVDTVLRLLLIGVTAGEGIGFSRAMLFLVDERQARLQGEMAIGAQSRAEADAIWQRLRQEANKLLVSDDPLSALLDQAEVFSLAVRHGEADDGPLSLAVKQKVIPLEECRGVLEEGRPVIIAHNQPGPLRKVIRQVTLSDNLDCAFACVPLVGRGRAPLGILIVDNRFLPHEREIDQAYTNTLETFASVAAMSIENARLRASYRSSNEQL